MSRRTVSVLASIGMRIAYGLAFSYASLFSLLSAQHIEHYLMPVVEDVIITKVAHAEGKLYLSGTMDKARDCRFLEAVAYSGSKLLTMRYLDDPDPQGKRTRSTGVQEFGPWEITPDGSTIKIVSRHACHSLWDSTTDIFEGPV